jgi:hypothetical protein
MNSNISSIKKKIKGFCSPHDEPILRIGIKIPQNAAYKMLHNRYSLVGLSIHFNKFVIFKYVITLF